MGLCSDNDNKIAIVGMSCRFPSGKNIDEYWDVLENGRDVVSAVPEGRLGSIFYQHPDKNERGKSYTFSAGVLDTEQVETFDARFFGISPREAAQLDPQQRLLLELAWESIEDAGQPAEKLKGSDTSVYIGIASTDYGSRGIDDLCSIDAYSMTGNTQSIAANRLSYVFDLQGPSVSVDTACSSSLVAFHQACQSILSGESSMALTGGINMLLHPMPFVGFSKASMLSPNGRCKAFSADGDGYVRSEGAAILLLKPLSQAEKDGDKIHAVILSSGINCDGATSSLTVPSAAGQGKLLESVYSKAQINLDDIDYFEAHGTGTAVGDPVESSAIGQALGRKRKKNNPLLIGSAKTNVGHMETASGMAGLIKVLLSIKNRAIPASLHSDELNPNIDFEKYNLQVNRSFLKLEKMDKPLLMGVNSFGFGGANAHVVIQEYVPEGLDDLAEQNKKRSKYPPLILSASSEASLQQLAEQYADLVESDSSSYNDLAWSAYYKRTRLDYRLLTHGKASSIVKSLRDYAVKKNEESDSLVACNSSKQQEKIAYVFSGNGCQWQGMGQVLLEQSALFRESLEKVDAHWQKYAEYSLLDELLKLEEESLLDQTEIAQPLLFALQVGVVSLLKKKGLEPNAVVGHSVGEVAAAWASGILSLQSAVRVIYERSFAQALTKGTGRMAAVGLGEQDVKELITHLGLNDIEIAGINSPSSSTVTGNLVSLQILEEQLEKENKFYRLLDLDYAFHSSHMDSIQTQVLGRLETLETRVASIPFISTVSGKSFKTSVLDASYWWENIRKPVKFQSAVEELLNNDFSVFVEIGAHPILRHYLSQCNKNVDVISTIQRKKEDVNVIYNAAYHALLYGAELNEKILFPDDNYHYVDLPHYPWQREYYWYKKTEDAYDLVNRKRSHPLLGYKLKEHEWAWENQIDTTVVPYLEDHVVDGTIVFPAAGYVEMALEASRQFHGIDSHELEGMEIHAPIVLEKSGLKQIQFILNEVDGSFRIHSRDYLSGDVWSINAIGRILGKIWKQATPKKFIIDSDKCFEVSAKEHYSLSEKLGLQYGNAFQGVSKAWHQGWKASAQLNVPDEIKAGFDAHSLHPSLLDGCFQLLVDIFREQIDQGHSKAMIPIQVGKIRLYQSAQIVDKASMHVNKLSPRSVLADYLLFNSNDELIAELNDCRFRTVDFNHGTKKPMLYQFERELSKRSNEQQASVVSSSLVSGDSFKEDLYQIAFSDEERQRRYRYYTSFAPLIDVLVSAFYVETLKLFESDAASLDDLISNNAFDVSVNSQGFLQRILTTLKEDNFLVKNTDQQWVLEAKDIPSSKEIWDAMVQDMPEASPELILLGRSGKNLYDYLSGHITAADILTPEKSSTYEHLLDSSLCFDGAHAMLSAVLDKLVEELSEYEQIRLLVFGSRGASWLVSILDSLPVGQYEVALLEFDEAVCNQVNSLYEDDSHVNAYKVEASISSLNDVEELSGQFFDLIIGHHCFYEFEYLDTILSELRQSLYNGGKLLFVELQPDRFTDITLGMQDSWWTISADATSSLHSKLLHAAEWTDLLEKQDYVDVEAIFESEDVSQGGAVLYSASSLIAIEEPSSMITAKETSSNEACLVISEENGFSDDVATYLKGLENIDLSIVRLNLSSNGQTEFSFEDDVITIDASNLEHYELAWNALQENGYAISELLYLPNTIPSKAQNADFEYILDSSWSFSSLVKSVRSSNLDTSPRLNVVTLSSPICVATKNSDDEYELLPEQSVFWGLSRVIMNEYPELQCRIIAWEGEQKPALLANQLIKELASDSNETEVILAEHSRFVPRMKVKSQLELVTSSDTSSDVSLDFLSPGQFKQLYWRGVEPKPLAADEIAIKPKVSGINFRDVMYSMGLLSDEAVENGFAGATLGLELSGVVTDIGADVSEFSIGDEVIGFAPACLSSRVVTKTTAIAHKPEQWSFRAAATIPTTFFTAYYALVHLAQLQPGEKILIHGASGGVGLAAIQISKYLELEIFATAGTDEKRDYVALLGADHVMDSRSLKFADDVLIETGGEGVDAVLNVISGEAVNRNLSVLKPFGRFLEIGKRDFYENSKIGLRPFRNNISYFGIDADQLLVERSELARRLFAEMMSLFKDGSLRPLPYRVFVADQVQEAFRYIQQSRQIGKVLISFESGYPKAGVIDQQILDKREFACQKEKSYLVTGGTRGFGLKTAEWLVSRGAESLVLVSRSGKVDKADQHIIEALQSEGAHIEISSCDVSDGEAVRSIIDRINISDYPLAGIVHAAMVLDDTLLQNMSKDQLERVLKPKVKGAWNLHKYTESVDLDLFLMYSSVTTYIGNPGQANYVAGNSYLEGLVNYRRHKGLTGQFVAWGAIDDAGYLTRNEDVKDALESRTGRSALPSSKALGFLDRFLHSGQAGICYVDLDWAVIQQFMPAANTPKYHELSRMARSFGSSNQREDIQSMIQGLSHSEVVELIQGMLVDEVAQILRLSGSDLDLDKPISEVGMDSLMGMELVAAIDAMFSIKLPIMQIAEGATISKITGFIADQLMDETTIEKDDGNLKDMVKRIGQTQGEEVTDSEASELAKRLK